MDTFEKQAETRIQQELLYNAVITKSVKMLLHGVDEIYTFLVILISLNSQRIYEKESRNNILDPSNQFLHINS